MSRNKSLPPLKMTSRQRQLLEQYKSKHQALKHYCLRINILLNCLDGYRNTTISRILKVNRNTVIKWRKRWLSAYDELCEFESGLSGQGVSDGDLLAKMLKILGDLPGRGAPKRITLSQENQIIALACKKPEDFDIPITQWNRELLAQVAVEQGIVKRISPRYISEILKKEQASTP